VTKLAIVGYGKMGRMIEQLAPASGFTVCARLDSKSNANGAGLTHEALAGADVAVEFSRPDACVANIERLAAAGVNVVCGTTGWHAQLPRVREIVQRAGIGFVWSSNFSVGVNLFLELVGEAARLFANREDYGAWGWEIHHSTKKDAPSGTMIQLLDEMKRAGYAREVNVSSSRAGTHPGTHEIGFDSAADSITLRHTARSREGFARGALMAAQWISGRRGVFEFRDVLFAGSGPGGNADREKV
jgi:4-hydroxy-tetrahydrodipicolinate reductase